MSRVVYLVDCDGQPPFFKGEGVNFINKGNFCIVCSPICGEIASFINPIKVIKGYVQATDTLDGKPILIEDDLKNLHDVGRQEEESPPICGYLRG